MSQGTGRVQGTVVLVEPKTYSKVTQYSIESYLGLPFDDPFSPVTFHHAHTLEVAQQVFAIESLPFLELKGPIVAVILESIAGLDERSTAQVAEFVETTRKNAQRIIPTTPLTVIGTSLLRREVPWSDIPTVQTPMLHQERERFSRAVRAGLSRRSDGH